jgi:hypothetical protein
MSRSGPPSTARDELRAQLMAAARREQARLDASPKRRKRRWRRRGFGVGVAILLGGAVAATATDLISTGEPVRDRGFSPPRFQPAQPGALDLVAKASDPARGAWGVAIYSNAEGLSCAIAGQVRGNQLGVVRDGRFHPYAADSRGACGKLGRRSMIADTLTVRGAEPRTILYGRARPGERTVIAEDAGTPKVAKTARGGGFIFVFKGEHSLADLRPRVGSAPRPEVPANARG